MTQSATTWLSFPNTLIVLFFFSFAMHEEKEKAVSSSSGPAGAASKHPNQVSIDTMAKPSRTTALKSSEFHKYGKQHLFSLTRLVSKNSSDDDDDCNLAFDASLPQQGASLLYSTCQWGNEGKPYCTSLFIFPHQHSVHFPQRQHNLHWEMSSCTEHDLRFHLLLKCLGCRRILAELAGLHFLWTHHDVGCYVRVITSWAKAYAVYSLEYFLFFLKGIPVADTCEI